MRKYRIPDTRLPFVNAEIAEIEVNGQLRLVSSIWGGDNGGRIYIFDPDTGESICRRLPEGIGGAYMLRTADDGLLYLGCGEGSLVAYDPQADRFEILVSGELNGITWGGCVTDSLVAWSASPGDACVYDWRKRKLLKVFKPLDSAKPTALYAHNVLECPDGKILLGVNVPQARLILLDPVTLKAESHTPDVLKGQNRTRYLTFLDTGRLALLCNNEILVLRYPSFELIRRIGPPECTETGNHRQRICCLTRGNIYSLFWPGGNLYRVDSAGDESEWELVREQFVGDAPATLHALADRYVCALDAGGRFLRYDTQSGEVFECELDSVGPMDTHSICVVPQIGRVFGGPFINQRFWEIDLQSGRGRDLGRAAPGGGEICVMVWDNATARLIMANYTICTITAFDPAAPACWPDNPRILAKVGHEQMRPAAIAHDGRFVWLVSSPEYGRLGGALSRIDPQTGEIRVWRNIVPNQTPNSLQVNPAAGQVYFATDIYGDGASAQPTEPTAQLVAFNTKTLSIDRRQAVGEEIETHRLLAMLPSGAVLGLATGRDPSERTMFAWDPAVGAIEHLGPAPADGLAPLERPGGPEGRGRTAAAPDGRIFASIGDQVCEILLNGSHVSFQPIVRTPDAMAEFMQVVDGKLYAVVDNEIWAIPLK